MMTSLFSVFDPSSWGGLSLNWVSSLVGLGLIPVTFWASKTRAQALWGLAASALLKEFKLLLGSRSGSVWLLLGLFAFIFFNNSLGLAPYIFTSTAHISLSLSLALPLWVSFMLYGWLLHTTHMFAHLVPQGTPGPLMMFMVLIETVSNVIRPVTLSIRLSANMVAGHLLLTLMGNAGSVGLAGVGIVLSQTALVVLELAVAAVQAYVFAVLTALYASEV